MKNLVAGFRSGPDYEGAMVSFLRELIAIPSESCQEGKVVERIRQEMERVGFDEVKIDPMGISWAASAPGPGSSPWTCGHRGIGDPEEWELDPYKGKLEDGIIHGRGATDQTGAMASMVYAARIIKDGRPMTSPSTWWVP